MVKNKTNKKNKCDMCGIDCGCAYQGYNTYPESKDNKHFIFCSDTCLRNFIDFCLTEFGEDAKKLRKKDENFGRNIYQEELNSEEVVSIPHNPKGIGYP